MSRGVGNERRWSEREDARDPRETIDLRLANYFYRSRRRKIEHCDQLVFEGRAIGGTVGPLVPEDTRRGIRFGLIEGHGKDSAKGKAEDHVKEKNCLRPGG